MGVVTADTPVAIKSDSGCGLIAGNDLNIPLQYVHVSGIFWSIYLLMESQNH